MELQCHYCYSGRGLLTYQGEYICENCGIVLETPEEYNIPQPYLNKIVTADTDTPIEYRNTKDKKRDFIEYAYGRYTKTVRKKPQILTPIVDREAVMIRIEQRNMIKLAICEMTEKLGLDPEKVLNRFDSLLKKVPLMGLLKTDNIITNKRHKRTPNVVASGFIFKVYRNQVTIRKLRSVSGCGGKSLQKVLRLLN